MSETPIGPSARWITHPDWREPADDLTRVPLLRTKVVVADRPSEAWLHLTGLGVWRASWDDVPVDDALLEPGSSDPRVRVAVTSIDLTARCDPGRQQLVVELGEGPGHVRASPGRYTKFVGPLVGPRLIAQLDLTGPDGERSQLVSDESWQAALGATLSSHWYGGEDHDDRVTPGPWVDAVVLGDRDTGPRLWRRASPPVRVVERLSPVGRTRIDQQSLLVDFGVNHAGLPALTVPAGWPSGSRVELWPAEDLDLSGHVDQTSTGKPIVDRFTTAGTAASWSPRFAYHGYRYVEIRTPAGVDPDEIVLDSHRVRSDNSPAGSFSCGDPALEVVHTLTDRAVQSNLFSVLTDCPHREKLGWLEQLHLVFPVLAHLYDVHSQLSDMITHLVDAQTDDGLIPDIAPELTRFGGGFRDDVNWGSAVVRLPYELWQTYGDLGPARAAWGSVDRYLGHVDRRLRDGLLPDGLADWKTLDDSTPDTLVHGHGYLRMVRGAAELAAALGVDPAPYTDRAEAMTRRLTAEHVGAGGLVSGGSQAAYALALDAGLVPAGLRTAALTLLLDRIEQDDQAMTVGEIGLPALVRVLAGSGRHRLLGEMVRQRRHPGYGQMVATGCTALAETWEVVQGEASANHFMLGYIVDWLTGHVAGLRRASVGWRSVIIEPHGLELTDRAAVSQVTRSGHYSLSWQRDGNSAELRLEIPENASAEVRPPAGWRQTGGDARMGPGRHRLELRRVAD